LHWEDGAIATEVVGARDRAHVLSVGAD
jgi:hypothetical protein